MKTLVTSVLLICCFWAFAQDGCIRVRLGEPVKNAFPDDVRLRYKEYSMGRVMFANGKLSPYYKMNYDLLLEEMVLIRQDGDTVLLLDPHAFNLVVVGNTTYFRPGGAGREFKEGPYYEVAATGKELLLGVRDAYFFRRRERRVDLGYYSYVDNVNSLVSFKSLGGNLSTYNMDTLWKEYQVFYIIDKEGNVSHLNKATLHRLFPVYRGLIDNYIEVTKTRLHSRPEVEKLFAYCVTLGGK